MSSQSDTHKSRSICVFGATGNQGATVIDHLERSKYDWTIRAVTRNFESEKAKQLAARKCVLVKAHLDNADEVKSAIDGCDFVFLVTSSHLALGPEQELLEAKTVIHAIRDAGKDQVLVWSSSISPRDLSGGKLCTLMFDQKADIQTYALSQGLKVIAFIPSVYIQNILDLYLPPKQVDGSYLISLPIHGDVSFETIDISRDGGAFVVGALEDPTMSTKGGDVFAASTTTTMNAIVKLLSDMTGKTVRYEFCETDKFPELFPGAPRSVYTELAKMWKMFDEYGCLNGKLSDDLIGNWKLQTIESYFGNLDLAAKFA